MRNPHIRIRCWHLQCRPTPSYRFQTGMPTKNEFELRFSASNLCRN